ARILMAASFVALILRPIEMLRHIRNIYITPRDANLCQSLIQQLSDRCHEGMTREIFSISGLLANEDDFSMCAPFAEHRLGSSFPKVASLAVRRGHAQARESWFRRDQRSGGLLRFRSGCLKVFGHGCIRAAEFQILR